MTPEAALIELLERVGARNGAAVLISDHELNEWPSAAVAAMKKQGLLTKARPATSTVCPGCERECVMAVHTLPDTTPEPEAFVVCDKRGDINRVRVPAGRLTQWQCSADAVCGLIIDSLALRRSGTRSAGTGLWKIGVASGNKRSQMLCLKADGDLSVVVGSNAVPLAELIGYRDGAYALEGTMIRKFVDSVTTADSRYTPNNARREARKLDTQAMYESWRKAYRELKTKRRNMSDVWYAQQIAKTNVAQGRDADTIRKRMKK